MDVGLLATENVQKKKKHVSISEATRMPGHGENEVSKHAFRLEIILSGRKRNKEKERKNNMYF